MKYEILYNNGEILYANNLEEKDAYVSVLNDIGESYTVTEQKPKQVEEFNTCIVSFPGSSKLYTYLRHDETYERNSYVVVETFKTIYGAERMVLSIAEVACCSTATKEELEKVLPFDRYKHVVGRVVFN